MSVIMNSSNAEKPDAITGWKQYKTLRNKDGGVSEVEVSPFLLRCLLLLEPITELMNQPSRGTISSCFKEYGAKNIRRGGHEKK